MILYDFLIITRYGYNILLRDNSKDDWYHIGILVFLSVYVIILYKIAHL